MRITRAAEARQFGQKLVAELENESTDDAYSCLSGVLSKRTPFRLLDLIGEAISDQPNCALLPFMDKIARHKKEGGWVVIASALRPKLNASLAEMLEHARKYIIQADVWYACDIFGERVLGSALVNHFLPSLSILKGWRCDTNRWVRRSLGAAGHFWAKRCKGAPERADEAVALLSFYRPLLAEVNIDAARGIGWALKTMGRYDPQRVNTYMEMAQRESLPIAAVIRQKAYKFIPQEVRRMNES